MENDDFNGKQIPIECLCMMKLLLLYTFQFLSYKKIFIIVRQTVFNW